MSGERLGTAAHPLRVAIVGAGPTGFYAADQLLRQDGLVVEIDMFDRVPTPFGLVRAGVAPDHQKIKSVTAVFDKVASHPRFRFYGCVELGKHVSVEDLRAQDHQFDLSVERAAVVGVGNVAIDVARLLCRTPEELAKTDISDQAMAALGRSRIKEVYLLGRRG